MSNTITTNKFVELTYRIIDQTSGEVIEQVEEPLGYVQGDNTLLFNQVTKELEGKSVGDVKLAQEIDAQKIDQSKLVPLLVKAIQELSAKNDALEARIKKLEDA